MPVSRGGLKLDKAVRKYGLDFTDMVTMDVGASTGGFTDCMLQNGAVKVYAVDVGYGQLAWSLRTDERVVNMERTNIRNVKPEDLSEPVAFFSVDVSFISLKLGLDQADAYGVRRGNGISHREDMFERNKRYINAEERHRL